MNKKTNRQSLLKTSLMISVIIAFSKALGFIREAVIAALYGVTGQTDAFFFAQGLPGLIFPSICGGISTAFISTYLARRMEKGENAADKYASGIIKFSFFLSAALSIFAIAAAPLIVPFMAPGFLPEKQDLTIFLSRIVMITFSLKMMEYMLTAVLNAKNLFIGSQISNVICNAVIILLVIVFGRNKSIYFLTSAVIAGDLVQFLCLLVCCYKKVKFSYREPAFTRGAMLLMKLSLPILLGNAITQINNIVDKGVASTLSEGAVSALNYSSSLNNLVISIFITSLATVLYPNLIALVSAKKKERFNESVIFHMKTLWMILLPVSLITMLSSHEIVEIVYARGRFVKKAVSLTSTALFYYGGQYVFYGIREVLVRAFYARRDTKTAFINTTLGVLINILCSIFLSKYIGIGGVALGTTISAIISSLLLMKAACKKIEGFRLKDFTPCFLKTIAAAIVLVILWYFSLEFLRRLGSFFSFMLTVMIGGGVYLLMLYLLKCRELQFFFSMRKGEETEENNE